MSLLGRHENGLSLEIRFKPFVTTAPTNPGHLVSAKGYGGGHLQSVHADVSGSDPARDVIRAPCITAKDSTAQPEGSYRRSYPLPLWVTVEVRF
jgi:hypothetical protein